MIKKLLIIAIVINITSICFAEYVSGYRKKSGTYVAPYQRTKADEVKYNNYSYKPSKTIIAPIKVKTTKYKTIFDY